jgi:hypothetical protein
MAKDSNNPEGPPQTLDELREKLAPRARELSFEYGRLQKQDADLKGWGFVAAALMLGPSRDEFMAGLKDGGAPTTDELAAQITELDSRLQAVETQCEQIANRLASRTLIALLLFALLVFHFWL